MLGEVCYANNFHYLKKKFSNTSF